MDDKKFIMVMIGTIAVVIIMTLGINMMLADYWGTEESDNRFDYKNSSNTTKIATALLYGDCHNEDVNITADITLSSDQYYRNLFINKTKRINPNGWKIFVCNYTYFYGELWNKGNNGTSAVRNTGGAGGTVAGVGNVPPNSAGGAGRTGVIGMGASATSPPLVNTCMSNYSGTGGDGGDGTGGIGGDNTGVPACSYYMARNYLGMDYVRQDTTIISVFTASGAYGGASGGGNGSGTGPGGGGGGGGGGGASGGSVWLASKHIVFGGTNSPPYIRAIGGHGGGGGNATCYGNCCGGGGGGQGGTGGSITIIYDTFDGDLNFNITTKFNVSGGIGGAGGSKTGGACASGTAGDDGTCGKCLMMDADDGILIPCGCDTTFTATGATPTPSSTELP